MLNFSADCRPRWRIKWVMNGGSLRPLESLCRWLPTKLGWPSGFWVTADCLFFGWLPKQLIADHWLWILWFRLNAEIGKGGVDLLDVLFDRGGRDGRLKSTQEFLQRKGDDWSSIRKANRGRSRRRVDATINCNAFTFWTMMKKIA